MNKQHLINGVLLSLLLTFGVGCSGGGDAPVSTFAPAPVPEPDPLPSGSAGDDSGTLTGSAYTFALRLYVTAADGTNVSGLTSGDFSVNASSSTLDSVAEDVTLNNGPFSAALLVDQSGSMRSADPFDLRIDAAEIFFNALSNGNNAALYAFAGSGDRQLADTVVPYSSGYVTSFPSSATELKDLEGGWSPLFDSTYYVLDLTAEAPNANRAVVVLTDGDDVEPAGTTYSVTDVASRASQLGIEIHTIGLGEDANGEVLSFMANSTGGTYTIASEAAQLEAALKTLSDLLSGKAVYYRVTITTLGVSAGDTLTGEVQVLLDSGETVTIPYSVTVS